MYKKCVYTTRDVSVHVNMSAWFINTHIIKDTYIHVSKLPVQDLHRKYTHLETNMSMQDINK